MLSCAARSVVAGGTGSTDTAIYSSRRTVRLNATTYIFKQTLNISSAKDLLVQGSELGTYMLFPPELPQMAVRSTNCNNLRITNVSIDYFPKPYSQGYIVQSNGSLLQYYHLAGSSLDPELSPWIHNTTVTLQVFDLTAPGRPMLAREYGYMTLAHDARRNPHLPDRFELNVSRGADIDWTNATGPNRRLTLCPRRSRALVFSNTTGLVLENVSLRASTGFGILELAGGGASTYRNLSIGPGASTFEPPKGLKEACKASPVEFGPMCKHVAHSAGQDAPDSSELPMMGTNADGLHVADVERGPLVEASYFDRSGDDHINIHGSLSLVWRAPWRDPELKQWRVYVAAKAEGIDPGTTEVADPLSRAVGGDSFRVFRLNTFEDAGWLPIAAAGIRRSDSKTQAELAQADSLLLSLNRTQVVSRFSVLYEFSLRDPLALNESGDASTAGDAIPWAGVRRFDVVEFSKFTSAGATVRDCSFGNGYVTGMKFKSVGGTVENNRFSNLHSWAITLFPEQFFMEGSASLRDVKVRGNYAALTAGLAAEIGGNGLTWNNWTMPPRLFQHLSWEGNTVADTPGEGMRVKSCGGCTSVNTTLINPAQEVDAHAVELASDSDFVLDCLMIDSNRTAGDGQSLSGWRGRYLGPVGVGQYMNKNDVRLVACSVP